MEKPVGEGEGEGEGEDGGKKRGRSNLRESDEPGAASKKVDPVPEFWGRKIREAREEEMAKYPDEDWCDVLGVGARRYREGWESSYQAECGPFDKITPIPPMRFTDEPMSYLASDHYGSLQFFSIKIREKNSGALQWPLHVYGFVAARDTVDYNRNIIFSRERGNCQILTEQDPYLVLTGPTRAVVVCKPVYFEVVLKLKGSTESGDKELSYLTVPLASSCDESSYTRLIKREYTSRLSTLELAFGYVVATVEATINVQVTDGAWPVGFYGRFTAYTASLEDNKIALLDSGDEMVSVDADGVIKLSRRVVSVEPEGELKVSVVAFGHDSDHVIGKDNAHFTPKRGGKSLGMLDVGFCKMEVSVFWSLVSLFPDNFS